MGNDTVPFSWLVLKYYLNTYVQLFSEVWPPINVFSSHQLIVVFTRDMVSKCYKESIHLNLYFHRISSF